MNVRAFRHSPGRRKDHHSARSASTGSMTAALRDGFGESPAIFRNCQCIADRSLLLSEDRENPFIPTQIQPWRRSSRHSIGAWLRVSCAPVASQEKILVGLQE